MSNCRYCAVSFDLSRNWQLFCSPACRLRYNRENKNCFYCGQAATTRDHIEPVSVRSGGRFFEGLEYIRACRECNTWLGNKLFETVSCRVGYIASKLYKKYRLHVPKAQWETEELEGMGPNMQHVIKKSEFKLSKRKARYEYACAVQILLEIDENEEKEVKQ